MSHRGLKRFLERDDPSGLPQAVLAKITDILTVLRVAPGPESLRSVRIWKVHALSGDRKGTWSFHATRNWRITFRIDETGAITDLNLEDYH